MPCFPIQIVQIAMFLRDTTTDENELAMGYTVPQERLRRGRSETPVLRARYKSDRRRLQAPTVCCSHKGKHVEKDLFQARCLFEKKSDGGNTCR